MSYLDTLECLGYAMPNELGVSLILNSLNKDYDQFIHNYNMHSMGKTLAELHTMPKLHEKGIPKKDETPAVLAIHEGLYLPPLLEGWSLEEELSVLPYFRKLKHGTLSLYMENGIRAAVEAIGSFDLILPSGLIIVLDNCHFAPTITRVVVSISRLVNNGYIHTFTNYGISVLKDNVFYFNAISHDGDLDETPIYKTALANPGSDKWLKGMNTEMQSMKDNQVWYLVDLPSNGRIVGCKWLFKKKTDMDGNVHTFKACLMAKGFTQTYEVDYGKIFSPAADIRAIRILLAIVAFYDYKIWQMDVKTTFLNGHLSEDVYMVQPEGFVDPKHPNK
nr:putative retrotransposon Ty1-copia subclass protein [Tanacetum cinerariifolium]